MSKFCGNCGRSMPDDAKVCGICGTPFETTPAAPSALYGQPYSSASGTPYAAPSLQHSGSLGTSSKRSSLLMMYLVETVLLILLGVLCFVKMAKIEFWGFSQSLSMFELCENVEFIPGILCALLFVSAIITAAAMFVHPEKQRKMVVQILVSILALAVFIFVYTVSTSSDDAQLVDPTMTFGGILFIISAIASFLFSVFIAIKTKEN